ncbi:tetratricopeptide repeat protein [uncultured Porphyromonas sp.]|uniref:tetratricopeptide repeat protein n=1 Tax=uncultured Porphyromonas sp. TaxID=159274 RepID=UPI00263889D4|nr:tetratricopeptide repeat protein [uncultured Porphyromonas sp.]
MRSKLIYILCLTAFAYGSSSAQWIKSDVRRAGKLYKKGNYAAASAEYRRAILKDSLYAKASFGLANSAYQEGHYDQAKSYLERLAANEQLPQRQQADVLHNLGNVAMKQKDYRAAVEAYEEALIRNPQNEGTRYNLVLAQRLLKQQEQQQKDNKQQQNKQDQQQQQQQDKQKDKQDPKKQDQQQNAQQKQDNKQQGGKPAEPRPGQMSKEQAEQLLNSFRSDDEQTRRRVEQRQREEQSQNSNKNKKRW